MTPAQHRRPYYGVVAIACVAAVAASIGIPAQAQAWPVGPEAAVVAYRVFNHQTGKWDWDKGISPAAAGPQWDRYYFDFNNSGVPTNYQADGKNIWSYRWGDQVQIAVEVALPIYWRGPPNPPASGTIAVVHGGQNATDPIALPVANAVITRVRGTWYYKHESWTNWGPPVPGEWPVFGVNDARQMWLVQRDINGFVTGIDWSRSPSFTYWNCALGSYWFSGDREPGAGTPPDPPWMGGDGGDPWLGWQFRFDPVYFVDWQEAPADGDVYYPSPVDVTQSPGRYVAGGPNASYYVGGYYLTPPFTPGDAVLDPNIGGPKPSGQLNQNDLAVDWEYWQMKNNQLEDPSVAGWTLPDYDASGVPRAEFWHGIRPCDRAQVDPLFYHPNAEKATANDGKPFPITSASLELVGPDLDPYRDGVQAPRWTLTNGRLASSVRGSDLVSIDAGTGLTIDNRNDFSKWVDTDQEYVVRWDNRTSQWPQAADPNTKADAPTWKRIVRLVFGATGYPGSRGKDPNTQQTVEGRYNPWDDPDGFRIGPQPGLKTLTTESLDTRNALFTGLVTAGLPLESRRYAADPSIEPPNPNTWVGALTGQSQENPWVPGYWTIKNVVLTVSPDPYAPDLTTDAASRSYRTIVAPVYPKAPWDVRNPENFAVSLTDGSADPLARNWFAVENPLDVEVARKVNVDRNNASDPDLNGLQALAPDYASNEIGKGRFGFVGNPGRHDDQRGVNPTDPTPTPHLSGGGRASKFTVTQGNHDFLFRAPFSSAPTGWNSYYWITPKTRTWVPDGGGGYTVQDVDDPNSGYILGTSRWVWEWDDWGSDGDPQTSGATDPPRRGWSPPILDLGAGMHATSIGWVRSGPKRASDGLWVSNLSHSTFYRTRETALYQDLTTGSYARSANLADVQDNGPGVVRFELPPLRPIVTETTGAWVLPNPGTTTDPPVTNVTASAQDYLGRALPNPAYPSIPGQGLRLSVGGRDVVANGLPPLPWSRSDAKKENTVSRESAWRASDDGTADFTGLRKFPDTVEPERVTVVLDVPPHQPAMASAGSDDWRTPTGPLEITVSGAPNGGHPVNYYGTMWPDDAATVPPFSGPGTEWTDFQPGTATLRYDVTDAGGPLHGEEDFMVKAYIDVNGNGKLDLARPDIAERQRTAGNPYWYVYLYEEPYRAFTARAKVLPSYEIAPSRQVADFGTFGHADPRSWYTLPERDLAIVSRGNFPLGILPMTTPDGTPRLGEVALWPASHWRSDEAEQGILMPLERLLPNYLRDRDPTNGTSTGWSFEPGPPGVPTASGDPFIDGLWGPRNGQVSIRANPAPTTERLGSRAVADALAAGTPLGTYWLDAYPYIDLNGIRGRQPADPTTNPPTPGDSVYASPIKCKVTIRESPLPPVNPGPTRESTKFDVFGNPLPNCPDANSGFGELGPAFITNTWAADPVLNQPGMVAPRVLRPGGATSNYGDTTVFFSSNRPLPGAPGPLPGGSWNIWAQSLHQNWDNTGPSGSWSQWRPINPTLEPAGPVFPIAGDPAANPAWNVTPPDPTYTAENSYRHYAPYIALQPFLGPGTAPLALLTWTLEVEWSQAAVPGGKIAKTFYIGVALVSPQNGFMGHNAGEVIAGPFFLKSDAGARFAPKAALIPTAGGPFSFDAYVYYYLGSGNQRRIGYALWHVSPAANPPLQYVGTHELPVMTRYATSGVRLDGLQYARDPYLFPDTWYGASLTGSGNYVWHGGPSGVEPPSIGVVFTGRSTSFGTEDVYYTRFEPSFPLPPLAPLNDPANYNPTYGNTGQVPFRPFRPWDQVQLGGQTYFQADLVPLRREALPAVQDDPTTRRFTAYASEKWVDWLWDPDLAVNPIGIQITVGGTTFGPLRYSPATPNGWREDPVSGYLYANNPGGSRAVEMDPTIGLVRVVDEMLLATLTPDQTVHAVFIPQTLRLTRASQDSSQPFVSILPPENVSMPWEIPGTGYSARSVVPLPMRMVLLYKRHDPQGRMRLMYETFAMPFSFPGAVPPPGPGPGQPGYQLVWEKVTDATWPGLPAVQYPTGVAVAPGTGALSVSSWDTLAFYVDRPPTHVPLDETVGELHATAQPVRYVWFTDQNNTRDPATAPACTVYDVGNPDPFLGLTPVGPTVNVSGPLGPETLQEVVGPTVLWFMFSSTAEKTPRLESGAPGELWAQGIYGLFGAGDEAAYLYNADWDLYLGVLSPQAIPRAKIYDIAGGQS